MKTNKHQQAINSLKNPIELFEEFYINSSGEEFDEQRRDYVSLVFEDVLKKERQE